MKKLINIYTGIFLLCVFLNILTVLIVGMTKICKADGNLLDKEKS